MRNLAVRKWAVVAAVSVCFGATGCATAQDVPAAPAALPSILARNIGPLVLRAHSDIASFEITAARGSVTARLTSEQSAEVNTQTCPDLQRVVDSYRRLPALRPGPILLLPEGWMSHPMAPTRKHGAWWTLTALAYAPDDTAIQIEMSGYQGPYPLWADEALAAIRSCIATP